MPCAMKPITPIANENGLIVIEVADQSVHYYFGKQALGSIGHLGACSYREAEMLSLP